MDQTHSASAERLAQVERAILVPNELDIALLGTSLDGLGGGGVDFADLYFELSSHDEWRLENGEVTRGSFAVTQGVGARAVSGDRVAFAYASDLSPRSLTGLIDATRSMQRHGQDAARSGGVALRGDRGEADSCYPAIESAATLDTAEKIALLQRLDACARQLDPRIVHVTANLQVHDAAVLSAGSDGSLAADVRPLVQLQIMVLAESGAKRSNGMGGESGRYALCDIDDAKLDAIARSAVRTALVNLDARPAPAGVMSVVLGPGFPGVLLHEAVGHGLEADAHRKRSSVFTGYMGQQIAAKGVTVVDDGTVAGARGSLNVDDEGNPGARNVLVEDGKLVGLMQDRLSARMTNAAVTGNGRRQSYAHLPMPRMTNTFLEAGNRDPEEIIGSVMNGIYAVGFGGGTVDVTSGQFNFSTTEAYLIEDGRVTTPVSGATLIGMGHEALKHISMIGNDVRLDAGVCGKNGQTVPVCVGQPTIRIDEMVVGGAGA